MVNTNVKELASTEFLTGLFNGVANNQNVSATKDKSFEKIISECASPNSSEITSSGKLKDNTLVSKKSDNCSKDCYTSDAAKERIVSGTSNDIDKKQISKDLEKISDAVKEELMKKYGLTEEEMDSVIQEMGIEYYELLIPENLTNFVMQVTGSEDKVSLLMNNDFKDIFKNMALLADSLAEKYGIDSKQLNTLFEKMNFQGSLGNEDLTAGNLEKNTPVINNDISKSGEKIQVQQQTQVIEESNINQVKNPVTEEALESGVKNSSAVVVDSGDKTDIVQKTVETNDSIITKVLDEETVETGEMTSDEQQGEFSNKENDIFAKNSQTKSFISKTNVTNEDGMNLFNNISNQNQSAAVELANAVNNVGQTVDTESILKQIQDAVKVNLNGLDASMELQLNPESLGKVGVTVALKNGAITAQITAQNEAVKEAIESQVSQLKESMNSLGLKVEAVEVTIASHEFEQNLEQNNANPNEDFNNPEQKENSRQNLNIYDLGEIGESLNEEEALAAKIMLESGNRVDLTA